MLVSEEPVSSHQVVRSTGRRVLADSTVSTPAQYRVAAVPVFTDAVSDVIIHDQDGHSYLLAPDTNTPTLLDESDINSLGMFFEPSLDNTWHTASELHQMFYGATLSDS
jgi:hypothetical protein